MRDATAPNSAGGNKGRPASPSLPRGSSNDYNQEKEHGRRRRTDAPGGGVGDATATASPHVLSQDLAQDFHQEEPAFDAPPPQASPDVANTLCRVFTVLRNSCAGCPANNKALSHTGLAEAVSSFTADGDTGLFRSFVRCVQ